MTEPVFFVVERCPGGETAAIYHERLPERLTRKTATPLVYALRLDRLAGGEHWAKLTMVALYAHYCWLRDAGKLPPANLADPPRAKGEQGVTRGEYWTPPARAWPERPADPFPAPSDLALKPDAVAFIRSGEHYERAATAPDPRPSPSREDDGRGIFLGLT